MDHSHGRRGQSVGGDQRLHSRLNVGVHDRVEPSAAERSVDKASQHGLDVCGATRAVEPHRPPLLDVSTKGHASFAQQGLAAGPRQMWSSHRATAGRHPSR